MAKNDDETPKLNLSDILNMAKKAAENPAVQKPAEVEPPADMRQSALQMRQLHNSFVWAGWTDDQAVTLTAALLSKQF